MAAGWCMRFCLPPSPVTHLVVAVFAGRRSGRGHVRCGAEESDLQWWWAGCSNRRINAFVSLSSSWAAAAASSRRFIVRSPTVINRLAVVFLLVACKLTNRTGAIIDPLLSVQRGWAQVAWAAEAVTSSTPASPTRPSFLPVAGSTTAFSRSPDRCQRLVKIWPYQLRASNKLNHWNGNHLPR